MATIDAIARKRALAVERLKVAAAEIAAVHGVPPLEVPLGGHDPLAMQANQLDTIADYLDQVVEAVRRDADDKAELVAKHEAEVANLGTAIQQHADTIAAYKALHGDLPAPPANEPPPPEPTVPAKPSRKTK